MRILIPLMILVLSPFAAAQSVDRAPTRLTEILVPEPLPLGVCQLVSHPQESGTGAGTGAGTGGSA